jgi:uncharacterized membrane protein YsdA (DUF1294 family)
MKPYSPLLLFLLVYAYATVAWDLPVAVGVAYLVASAVCFVSYAGDKLAARRGYQRTPERTLLLLGLVGGWPGAVLAQQWLRHKTLKQPFRRRFWVTVFVNFGAFTGLSYGLFGAVS